MNEKKSRVIGLILVAGLMIGCSTGPSTPVHIWNLAGKKVIYLEQNDRVPVAVPLMAWEVQKEKQPVMGTTNVVFGVPFDPTVYGEVLKALFLMLPEMSSTYSNERMNELLISRRMLFKGYSGAELIQVNEIIKSSGGTIENWTPQK